MFLAEKEKIVVDRGYGQNDDGEKDTVLLLKELNETRENVFTFFR